MDYYLPLLVFLIQYYSWDAMIQNNSFFFIARMSNNFSKLGTQNLLTDWLELTWSMPLCYVEFEVSYALPSTRDFLIQKDASSPIAANGLHRTLIFKPCPTINQYDKMNDEGPWLMKHRTFICTLYYIEK